MEVLIAPLIPGAFRPFYEYFSDPVVPDDKTVALSVNGSNTTLTETPPGPNNPWDLLALMPGYELAARSRRRSKKTIDHVRLSVRIFHRFLLEHGLPTDVRLITVTILRNFEQYLESKPKFSRRPLEPQDQKFLSEYTINNYLRGVQTYWAWLVGDRLLETSLFDIFRVAKPQGKEPVILSTAQVESMIKAEKGKDAMAYRDRLAVLLLYDGGYRASELCGMEVANVNLEGNSVRVRGKGGQWRDIPLGNRAAKELWQYLKLHRPEPAGPWITNVLLTKNGKPLNKDTLRIIIKRLGLAAGITGVRLSPHTLRHSFATQYLRNGGEGLALMKIMGHKSLETLKIYVHLSGQDLAGAHKSYSPADRLR